MFLIFSSNKKDTVPEWLAKNVGLVKIQTQDGKGLVVGLIKDFFGIGSIEI